MLSTKKNYLLKQALYINCYQYLRSIFSFDGVWESELTNQVKKSIESHWKNKINVPYPEKATTKYYLLSMFPYPSGNLHMGHVRVYTISDAIARFLKMNGKEVIHPMGWDAFGLPAENAAIEKKIHPLEWTKNNIQTMKQQLLDLNINFDWDKELATCDSSYYKWTQYLFLLMYKHGLAYKKEALVNWDPIDQTVLADEQVDNDGCSWRSGCKVEKRRLYQWFLHTSKFSKALYDGLNDPNLVNWRDAKKIQEHWIGDCNGYIFHLELYYNGELLKDTLTIWTDVPEFIYGATFIGISPNNSYNISKWIENEANDDSQLKLYAIHPFTNARLPIYVTKSLKHIESTDSCLGIPSIDDECLQFALKHKIKVIDVYNKASETLMNSNGFSGLDIKSARNEIINKAKKLGLKVYQASKKLRDWLISRQRYWGTPIPIINCQSCKEVPVPLEDLPVLLPNLKTFSGKGSSLKEAKEWLHIKCPRCGGPATRETDTMDTFVDSSWYFLRYLDNQNASKPFDEEKVAKFMPVDLYIGGKEHAALHLFYARFLTHFLHSIKMLKYPEPFLQLLMQGMILGKSYRIQETGKYITKEEVDFSNSSKLVEKFSGKEVIEEWEKMSKSKYNGIDPQQVVEEYGIDTSRLFILGNVAPESPRKWNDELFVGISNWQWRIWLTIDNFLTQRKTINPPSELSNEEIIKYDNIFYNSRNYYIKGVTHNFINTKQLSVAITKLQGLTGDLRRYPKILANNSSEYEKSLASLIIMLSPLAPHFASELWVAFCSVASKNETFYDINRPVLHQKWPEVDLDCQMRISIKLNGEDLDFIPLTRREQLKLSPEDAIHLALKNERVVEILKDIKIRRTFYKIWPYFDSEVNIIFTPPGKKWKLFKKFSKAASSAS